MKDNDKHSNKQEFVLRLKLDLFFNFWSDFSAEKKDNFSKKNFCYDLLLSFISFA